MRFPGLIEKESLEDPLRILSMFCSEEHLDRLREIKNPRLWRDIAEVALVAKPTSIYVNTGSDEDKDYIRRKALENREEYPTVHPMHTVHFDGPKDLARDKENTRVLYPGGRQVPLINTFDRDAGLSEIGKLFRGVMSGKEMFVSFYLYGPRHSRFSLYGVQITDSAYVVHSEEILYRNGYRDFVEKGEELEYMLFIHSAGERDENGWSKNVENRRIFIDLEGNSVYSVNTQYAGNTVGLKKLALRLAIYKGYREGWLAEHMFIVGVKGRGGRISYFTGAYPAGCGKTSTAMVADTVVGDDLAIIHAVNGEARAINPEVGMFGIIDDVNPRDDPEIYSILVNPSAEVIFSNVLLMEDGNVWWRGKPGEPKKGVNYAGEWWPGKKDKNGKEIPPSHPNARFTVSIRHLSKLDPRIDDPEGVPVAGIIFGGRDSSTLPPVLEAFDWKHGIVTMGASLESERTAAVLGQVGVMELNPYAILDFLPISVGAFTALHLEFEKKLARPPKIFSVNYFLRENGKFLAEKRDKIAWLKWMEQRVHGEAQAIETPVGYIPTYEDLREIFARELGKEFKEDLYEKMFTIRVKGFLEKIERILKVYSTIPDTPAEFFQIMEEQIKRLKDLEKTGQGQNVSPFCLDKR